jgi:hypothetical protein
MSRPIFAAMAWNSDLGVVLEVSLLLARSRWDSASDLEDFEDIEDTAAWNSEVLFIGMIEGMSFYLQMEGELGDENALVVFTC